jgi:hypothetical protein
VCPDFDISQKLVDSLMEVDRDKKKKKEVNIVKNIFERRLL